MIDLRDSTQPDVVRAAQVLARVDVVAREAEIDYVVVGATARTILSVGLMGRAPERSTRDIDIAAAVDSWADFKRLTDRLEKRGGSAHSFLVDGVEVDVVPYGGVEADDRTILWPDDHRMNVRGLSEAVDSAQTVLLPGGIAVRVPSIPALALLKLLTWWDRRDSTTRDAIDLATMIDWYSSGEYLDRLYDEESEVLARHGFDPAPAGAWLLGRHMLRWLDHASVTALLRIVEDEDTLGRLASDMRAPVTRARVVVRAMANGIRDGARRGEGRV
jgi:predicted nucleotidyltransferase